MQTQVALSACVFSCNRDNKSMSPNVALPNDIEACHAIIRERLEYIPAKMVIYELHYPKRACGKCKTGVTVAPPPEADQAGAALTEGSRYGFGVTSQIILGKYADHLPLYRLEDVFARAGVVIPRSTHAAPTQHPGSTQVGLLDAAADLASPLCELMKNSLLQSNVVGMDDTPVRLQDPSMPGRMPTARVWLARGREEAPYNVFFFHESRQRDGPAKFLGDYQGWVTVDAYGVNEGVYLGSGGRILAGCCHAHARRKVLPKSAIGGAVRYALNQWKPLLAFTTEGSLPIDNNDTERDLRR